MKKWFTKFFAWLLKYDVVFESHVQAYARLHASNRFERDRSRQLPPFISKEEITALASQEAEQFYQSGSVPIDPFLPFIRIRARHMGNRQQVTDTYVRGFSEVYQASLEEDK